MTALKREAAIRWLGYPPGGAPRLTVGSQLQRAEMSSSQCDATDGD
jgi:hypothetical protein